MTDAPRGPSGWCEDADKPASSDAAAAIHAIETAAPTTPVLVDFDETLFLTNSTEEYLGCARPRILGVAILAVLGLVKPWQLMPSRLREHSRDWFRVLAVTLLMPWTIPIWNRRSRDLAVTETNVRLRDALASSPSDLVVITTLGFRFIVSRMVAAMGTEPYELSASRFWKGFIDRSDGKRARIECSFGRGVVERSIVVTDSCADRDLLDHAAAGFLVSWPGARFERALAGTYVPFYYLEAVKHPRQRFFLKTVLADDWLLAVLAVSWALPNLPAMAPALLLASLSFWVIYELGYMENDRVAATVESDPFLHPEYHDYRATHHWLTPWLWAGAFAACGLAVASEWSTGRSTMGLPFLALGWLALLVATRTAFFGFNMLNKRTRVWLYPVLQTARSFGLVILAPISLVGALALTAQVLSRSATYMLYRVTGSVWPRPSFTQLVRLIVFTLLVAAVAVAHESLEVVGGWQFVAILGWFVLRARRGIRDAVMSTATIAS